MTQGLMLLLSVLLMGMDGPPREKDDQRLLEKRQAKLATRIEALKQEQDFLLFQRTFAGSDSKYLLIDLSTKTGTLKYRNRILRTFGFTLSASKPHQPRKGRYVITGKTDGSPGKKFLVVQDAFIIHGKWYSGKPRHEKKLPAIVVGRKDLAAIYYAVEQGTMLYIFR
jgi:hypothetical protein